MGNWGHCFRAQLLSWEEGQEPGWFSRPEDLGLLLKTIDLHVNKPSWKLE